MSTRRQVLKASAYATLAAATAPFAAILRCYAPENQKPAKRIGTFEESAKATIEWIKNGKFSLSLLDEVERFRNELEFELDRDIHAALEQLRKRIGKNGNQQKADVSESVEAGGYVLDINTINSHLTFVFGKVKTRGKVGPYDVYLLEETEIAYSHSVIGTSTISTGRIYLFDDRIDLGNKLSEPEQWEKMIGYGINPNAVQAIVRNTLSKKEVSWTEFESLAENVAQNCSLQPELVQMALLIMRLFYLHQNREQDYSISLNEFRAQVLTHELAHLELYRTMGDKWFSEHVGSGEMFAMLVELTYGLRQYDRLRSIFEQYLGSACGAQEDRLNSGVSKLLAEHMLQHPWAGIKNLIAGPTEQDLSRIWTASSEKFSKEQIGKPFEELFDETRLTGDHNRFISGLYCQETGECEVKP